jgi:hypothetical protein
MMIRRPGRPPRVPREAFFLLGASLLGPIGSVNRSRVQATKRPVTP